MPTAPAWRLADLALLMAAVGLLVSCSGPGGAAGGAPDVVDYNWHVRPILADNCFACHGPAAEKRQAGLRLDLPASAYGELPESPGKHAIVRGRPEDSELIRRVTSADPDQRMPPPDSHKGALTTGQIATLRQWIEDGAEYKQHWAYLKPAITRPRKSAFDARAINDVDRYVFVAQQAQGLAPSPEADRETLINRVSLALTGLPPSLEEVDDFLADTSAQAYERVVDRLLGTPAYGEHMAGFWLSAARYADSDGFLDDHHDRLLWPYRDWVVNAFNRNMHFDQFGSWQIAGDLLARHQPSERSREQVLATTFLRVGRRTSENGAIDEEYRAEYMIDRTDTVGTALLGLTVGCARCHDHKYDAISQKDYYSLGAFFNSTDEPGYYAPGAGGVTAGPTLPWTDAATDRRIAAAAADIGRQTAALGKALQQAHSAAGQDAARLSGSPVQLEALLKSSLDQAIAAYYPFETTQPIPDDRLPSRQQRSPTPPQLLIRPPLLTSAVAGPAGAAAAPRAPASVRSPGALPRGQRRPFNALNPDGLPVDLVRKLIVWSPGAVPGNEPAVLQSPISKPGVRGNALWFDDINRGFLGRDVGYYERTQPFSVDVWVHPGAVYDNALVFDHRDDDQSGGSGYALHLEQGRLAFDMKHSRAGNVLRVVARQALPIRQWSQVTLVYDGSSRAEGVTLYLNGKPLVVDIERNNLTRTILPNARTPSLGDAFLGFGFGKRFREFTLKDGAIDELRIFGRSLMPLEVDYLHRGAAALRTPDVNQVRALLATRAPAVVSAQSALTAAREAHNRIVSQVPQIMVMGDTPTPRPAHVLLRGLYSAHGDPVEPAGLQQVFAYDEKLPRDRRGLAAWLFDSGNPLTARVYVNRIWQQHFGYGLVETAEDFGVQGSVPTHPELLDWLAVQFVKSGWDIKALHKTIVMSATFRQSSNVSDELLAKDPRNRWLARGLRIRMPAEMVRDNALAASGLLERGLGGPSVYPYQPAGIWSGLAAQPYPEADALPDDQHHRRSLYSFVKRNAPHPAMAVFDFPDRLASSVRRKTSNTPLQALVLMDDPQYVEAYRVLAANSMQRASDPDQQIVRVFRLATRRQPSAEELAVLKSYRDAEVASFANDRAKAIALVKTGRAAIDPALDVVQLAALTNVTAAIMNTPDAWSIR
jgi:hypothetical protein